MLSVFRDYVDVITCKKSRQKNVKRFPTRFKKHNTLYVFNNVGRMFLCKKSMQKSVKDFSGCPNFVYTIATFGLQ